MAARSSSGRPPFAERAGSLNAKRTLTDRADTIPALAEAFREHGFEGASLSILSEATRLGKGSLYNFFPGGKREMMEAVLADVDRWFATAIFSPLEQTQEPARAITSMIDEVSSYFHSGGRVCLVGRLGLSSSGETFAAGIGSYFTRWLDALTRCLEAGHVPPPQAALLAEETVSAIQGAIVLARALREEDAFTRIVRRHEAILLDALARHDQ